MKWLFITGMVLMTGLVVQSQQVLTPEEKRAGFHREVQDDPYLPNSYLNQKTSHPVKLTDAGIITKQVNVNADGENILGDAANEPSIAIDPADPNRMVIGWRQFDNVNSSFRQAGYAYSTDAGQTWTFPGVIEPGVFRSDPVLDFDADGFVYYNSLSSIGNYFFCDVFKSEDGGAGWNAGVDAHGGDKQWMTIDRSGSIGRGNIYSFWSSFYSSCAPGFFTRSTNSGSSFENCREVSGYPYWGTMAVGNDGELYIAGSSEWGGIGVAKSTSAMDPGSPVTFDFFSPVDLDGFLIMALAVNPAGLAGQAIIDVDRSNGAGRGNVYVLATVKRFSTIDSADVMFARSTDGGFTWSNPVRINDDQGTDHDQWFGTMSVAPNGRIDVIWLDTRDAPAGTYLSALYYAYSMDQGETWSLNTRLSPLFDPHVGWPQQQKMGDYFDMESDDDGAHLAWANTFNGEQDVYYSYIMPEATGILFGEEKWDMLSVSCFPNPVGDQTTIRYTIPAACYVRIVICDVFGKEIATLVEKNQDEGIFQHHFQTDFPVGYYHISLSAGGRTTHTGLVKIR